ncbi:MAG: hypothetical protein AAB426_12890, partial [Myxococcota bacterium]
SLGTLLERIDGLLGASVEAPVARAHASTPATTEASPAIPAAAALPDGWARVVTGLQGSRPSLASVLEHAQLRRFGADTVEIAYEPGSFYWDAVHERANRSLIESLLTQQFGRAVPLVVSSLAQEVSAPAVSIVQAKLEAREQVERSIREDALGHPAVRGAISILGGEVREVIPLARSTEDA